MPHLMATGWEEHSSSTSPHHKPPKSGKLELVSAEIADSWGPSLRLLVYLFALLVLLPTEVFATPREVKVLVQPTSISGSLDPFTLMVNGRAVLKHSAHAVELKLNGTDIKPTDGTGSRFFTQSAADTLDFKVITSGARKAEQLNIVLPRLRQARLTAATLDCRVEGSAVAVLFDGKSFLITGGKIQIPLGLEESWWTSAHSLHIDAGNAKPGRSYSLRFVMPSVSTLPDLGGPRRQLAHAPSLASTTSIASFQLGSTGAFQDAESSTFAPEVSWNPTLNLWRSLSLRGNFGLMPLKNNDTQNLFLATEYELLLSLLIHRILIEGGGGFQTWWASPGGTQPVIGANVGVHFDNLLLGVADRLFAGYQAVLDPQFTTHELKIGIGLRL